MKANVIKALRQLRDAHTQLTELSCSEINLNDLEALRLYPYHAPLDEVNVPAWCDETIKELTGIIPHVVNPICLRCNMRRKVTHTITGEKIKASYQCVANADCWAVYVPFNREEIVARLLADDVQQELDGCLKYLYKSGIDGYDEMEDYEVFQYYMERVEQYESNEG